MRKIKTEKNEPKDAKDIFVEKIFAKEKIATRQKPVRQSSAKNKKPADIMDYPSGLEKYAVPVINKKPAEMVNFPTDLRGDAILATNKNVKIYLLALAAVIVITLLGTSGYFYYQYKKATAGSAVKSEVAGYVANISKFVLLPEGEDPTLATVTDTEKIRNQEFFAKAENGDKVIIYSNAREVILYRPAMNKIVNMTILAATDNVTTGEQNPSQDTASQQNPSPSDAAAQAQTPVGSNPDTPAAPASIPVTLNVAVYNGSKIKGLAASLGDKISKIEGMNVTEKKNAVGNYDKTIVIDLSGNNTDAAQKIAEAIGGEAGSLPAGEKVPNADILVIGGAQ